MQIPITGHSESGQKSDKHMENLYTAPRIINKAFIQYTAEVHSREV